MKNVILDVIMNETFLTIFCGLIIFIVSQIILELMIQPLVELKKLKGKIICFLTMYDNYIANPFIIGEGDIYNIPDDYKKASNELRFIASTFAGHLEAHKIVCRKRKYYNIIIYLIKISNGLWINKSSKIDIYSINEATINKIYKILGLKEKF